MFSPRSVRPVPRPPRRRASAVLLLLALALGAGPAAAQIPGLPGVRPQPRPAPTRPPPADTVPGDTGRAAVQDTLIDRLLRLEGYQVVEYQGDSAQFDNRERTLRLRGRPVVVRGADRIEATDSIIYREPTDFVEVYGSPRVTGEGGDIAGEVIYYDLATRRATVRNARTTVTEGATWYVQGNVTTENQGERVYATGGTFTSDDREDPAYHFRAGRLKVIKNRVLVGRPAYLYFRNVPVFVLPFIVQDLARGRRSGFLIPEFEINDIVRTDQRGRGTRGTGRQISNIGYYWAINDYMGAQGSLDWRSQSWVALQVGYDFNWVRRFLSGSASLQHFWREEGNQFTLYGRGSWRPTEQTDIGASLNYASDTRFERDRQLNPFRQTSDISSTLSFSRRAGWGTVSSSAELRQSISTGDNNLGTQFNLTPQTITLFPTGEGGTPRWYNDASLTVNADARAERLSPGDALSRRLQGQQGESGSLGGNLRFGPISIAAGARYRAERRTELAAIDSAAAAPEVPVSRLGFIPGFGTEALDWNASTGYEFRLIGATRLTPNISVGQTAVRRDSAFEAGTLPDSLDERRYGSMVAAPMRVNFGAGLRTELFGFFPGVGGYERFRHHLSPELRYTFSPQARQDTVQVLVHGPQGGREVNEITFRLDQTFEARERPRRRSEAERAEERAGTGNPADPQAGNPGAQTDTAGVVSPGAATLPDTTDAERGGGRAGQPEQVPKVTLLAINTSALAYSFVPVDTFGTRFTTQDLTNSIRSDLLGGLNFTISHDLFDEGGAAPGGIFAGGSRRFSPFLTGVQTSLSFGASSALFRWLGFARATEGERRTERGQTPPEEGMPTAEPPGSQTMTGRALGTGGGAWNVSLTYSLRRSRPVRTGLPQLLSTDNQQVSGNVSFFPTRNWAVNWYTDYSITRNEFGTHVLNFKRDLYRWQANFDFVRAPNGNTAFSFSVHLTDLPDLKVDYSRQNLGADRAAPR